MFLPTGIRVPRRAKRDALCGAAATGRLGCEPGGICPELGTGQPTKAASGAPADLQPRLAAQAAADLVWGR